MRCDVMKTLYVFGRMDDGGGMKMRNVDMTSYFGMKSVKLKNRPGSRQNISIVRIAHVIFNFRSEPP